MGSTQLYSKTNILDVRTRRARILRFIIFLCYLVRPQVYDVRIVRGRSVENEMTTEFTPLRFLDVQVSKREKGCSRCVGDKHKTEKIKIIIKSFYIFEFYKIIVLRNIDQFYSDMDHTIRMHMHTVRMDSEKS
jgi:hypothetical protein